MSIEYQTESYFVETIEKNMKEMKGGSYEKEKGYQITKRCVFQKD